MIRALKVYIFCCILLILLLPENLFGQPEERERFVQEIGVHFLSGNQQFLNTTYQYKISSILIDIRKSLTGNESSQLLLSLCPQFGRSSFLFDSQSVETVSGTELGIGIYLVYNRKIANSDFSYYIRGGTGPHYLSEAPERQIPGFVFSNFVDIGITIKISDQFRLSANGGLRHMSNAKLRHPNGGLNNVIYGLGLNYILN